MQVTDLATGYGRRAVSRDVTLGVKAGEVLCLLGPNGCGKTTLFKTMLGLIPAIAGSIELYGRPIETHSRLEFVRSVAYVPQASGATFPFQVLDMVLMGRASSIAPFAMPSIRDRSKAIEALAALGINHLANRSFTAISGGERQMVLIARALAQESKMIVMDEPTASLDFGNQARVVQRIRRLADNGLSIVMSTHDPSQAFACADRVALMQNGRLLRVGPPSQVLTEAALTDLYGVDVAVGYVAGAGHNVCTPVSHSRQKETSS